MAKYRNVLSLQWAHFQRFWMHPYPDGLGHEVNDSPRQPPRNGGNRPKRRRYQEAKGCA